MQQLLTESETQVANWREKLLAALGSNGQVIIDVIPEVELIIGPQPAALQLGLSESQNRFNFVFHEFARVFAQKEHPLVIFLDDLQWADVPSLGWIQRLMSDPTGHYLLILGAYRDNEVGAAHPLRLTLDELQKAGVVLEQISLGPLDRLHVNQLVAETLICTLDQAAPLADLVLGKTDGNPFFLNQFLTALYEEKLLTFVAAPVVVGDDKKDESRGGWRWDVTKIREQAVTDNVVELMAAKIQRLSDQTRQALQLAACIGKSIRFKNPGHRPREITVGDGSRSMGRLTRRLACATWRWLQIPLGEWSESG
jgi:predicted ATPase